MTAQPSTVELLDHMRPSAAVHGTSALAPVPGLPVVAFYIRISRDRKDGAGAGLGVKRQLRECQRDAERRGWIAGEVYSDNDKSAKAGSFRQRFEDLLEDMAAGRVRYLLAWHMDRITRNDDDWARIAGLAKLHGVTIRTVMSGDIDLSTAAGRWQARQLTGLAIYESEHRTERQELKQAELAREGKPNGGRRRFGYNHDMTPRPSEAQEVADWVRRLLAGDSLQAIADDLNARQVPTSTLAEFLAREAEGRLRVDEDGVPEPRPNGHWYAKVVRRIVTSPHIIGARSHKGTTTVATAWQPLVSAEDWHAVARVLQANAKRSHGDDYQPTQARKWLLTGLARCAICDARVTVGHNGRQSNGGRTRTYRCPRGCLSRAADAVDLYVTEHAINRLRTIDATGALVTLDDDGGDTIGALRAELVDVEQILDSLAERAADPDDDLSEAFAARLATKHEARQADLQARLEAAEQQAGDNASRPLRVLEGLTGEHPETEWEALTLDRQRAVIDVLLSVHINAATGRGVRADASIVTVEPRLS